MDLNLKILGIQKDVKNWPFRIIEDEKTKKLKYIIKLDGEEKEYFPEDIASIILGYLMQKHMKIKKLKKQ